MNTYPVYDKTIDHHILAGDIKNQAIVQMDLDRCCGDYTRLTSKDCVVWEWCAKTDPNCHFDLSVGLDEAKIRYSSYWKRDVVIACSSSGWAGIIDYEAKTVLWEAAFSNCPHSAELLPNGDLLIAGSGGFSWETAGELVYISLSRGQTMPSAALHVPSCHGVQWDPERELAWVLGYYSVIGVRIAEDGTLQQVGDAIEFGEQDDSGHDLAPVYGEPGKYWISAHKKIWLFDAAEASLSCEYDRASVYSQKSVTGIAYFSDGTMVVCAGGIGENLIADWSTNALCISAFSADAPAGTLPVFFGDREFYKVRTFSKDYQ